MTTPQRLAAKTHNFMTLMGVLQGTIDGLMRNGPTLLITGPDDQISKLLQKATGKSATPCFLASNLIPIPAELDKQPEEDFFFSEVLKTGPKISRTALASAADWQVTKSVHNWCLHNWGFSVDLHEARIDRRFEYVEITTGYRRHFDTLFAKLKLEYPDLTFTNPDQAPEPKLELFGWK